MATNPIEVDYTCTCCFLTDFDSMNPIIYCEVCDTGVHQKCYGIDPMILEETTEGKGLIQAQ